VPAGAECDAFAGTIDLLPTFVALAGGEVPPQPVIDGRDISDLLMGTRHEPVREAHYYFKGTALQAVRDDRWKLAIAPQPDGERDGAGAGKEEHASLESPRLYDLAVDVGETTNVAADHPDVVARLRALAERTAAELCGAQPPGRRPPGSVDNPVFLYPVVEESAEEKQPARPRARKPAA
jgi:arylsulfatase A-like enzyme